MPPRRTSRDCPASRLNNAYKKLIKEYAPLYIEDPFSENDFKNFAAITAAQAGSARAK